MYEIFERLLQETGAKASDVCKATGIRSGVLSDWKKGRYTPKVDKRRKIAEFFKVSLEYLDTGDESLRDIPAEIDQAVESDPRMNELFALAKKASPEELERAIKIFHALIER